MASEQIRIVHAADIHLDSPLRGLGRLGDDDLAQRLRQATRAAFDNLITYCVETQPAALVLAGDLYDGDWDDYSTGVYFTNRMRDLNDAGVQVVVVQGNHDAESKITRNLTLPPNVHRLSTSEPETVTFDNLGLAVHGQGFATRAVSANLAIAYPVPISGLINVGLLHTSVAGYANHDPYAPCSLADLTGRGYEYFALGHVHGREILAEGRNTVAFSGNLQGRNPRECGAKGALDVQLTPGGDATTQFVELDVARWEQVQVDVSSATDEGEVFALIDTAMGQAREDAGTRPVVARIRITGTSTLAGRLANTAALDAEIRPRAARHEVAVEKITSNVLAPADRRHLPASQRQALDAIIASMLADPVGVRVDPSLKHDLDKLIAEVGMFTRTADADVGSTGQFANLVSEACQRLLAQAEAGLL